MPDYCVAYNCNSKHGVVDKAVSFHNFPLKVPELLARWVLAVRRKDWQPTKCSKLCSKHFTEDAFSPRPGAHYRLLKESAVPTIFDYSQHLKKGVKKERVSVRTLVRTQPESETNLVPSVSKSIEKNCNKEVSSSSDDELIEKIHRKVIILETNLQKKYNELVAMKKLLNDIKRKKVKIIKIRKTNSLKMWNKQLKDVKNNLLQD